MWLTTDQLHVWLLFKTWDDICVIVQVNACHLEYSLRHEQGGRDSTMCFIVCDWPVTYLSHDTFHHLHNLAEHCSDIFTPHNTPQLWDTRRLSVPY